MRKARHRARVFDRSSNGTKWRINARVLTGSFLLLASVALLQLRFATLVHDPSLLSDETQQLAAVKPTHDEKGGQGFSLHDPGGVGEERGQTIDLSRRQMGNGEAGSLGGTEGNRISTHSSLSDSLDFAEEGGRFKDLDDETDMKDEDLGKRVRNLDAGDETGSQAADRKGGLQEEGEDKDSDANRQRTRELKMGRAEGGVRVDEEAVYTGARRTGAAMAKEKEGAETIKTLELPSKKIRTFDELRNASQKSGGRQFTVVSTTLNSPGSKMPKLKTSDLYIRGRSQLKELEEDSAGRELPLHERDSAKGVALQDQSKGDTSTGVFSSDDQPVNEDTRHRLENMLDMEDVLMLKRGPALSSSGRIQDGESSKKEKRAKVSSDPLNPENNVLLQDPDSAGPGGLSKNDRALLKAWSLLKTFRWSNVKPLSQVDQNGHVSKHARVDDLNGDTSKPFLDLRNEHKDSEMDVSLRDTIWRIESENATDVSSTIALDQSRLGESRAFMTNALSEALLEAPTRKEEASKGMTTGKKRKRKLNFERNWRRYGYFPGLHPRLTFSDFMEEFLLDEECSMRIFMAWTTPPWSFTVRHQRVLESLLHFHPKACVVVFSETMEVDFFKGFVEDGYRVAAVWPDLTELLKDTPTEVFAAIWMEWRLIDLFYVHYSELLRLAALYKYGGTYLDWDMIVLRPLTGLNNTIGEELLANGRLRPNGAIMVFEKFSPFLNRSMEEFTATYDETLRDWNGAALLDRVLNALPDDNNVNLAIGDKPHVEPRMSFFPLSSAGIYSHFKVPRDEEATAQEDELLDEILLQSFGVHLWNGLTSTLIPEPGSLVEKLMERNCLLCSDIL